MVRRRTLTSCPIRRSSRRRITIIYIVGVVGWMGVNLLMFRILELASLTTAGLISKVKELHDIAYQLGVEEAKEITRGKYLNLFNKPRNNQ